MKWPTAQGQSAPLLLVFFAHEQLSLFLMAGLSSFETDDRRALRQSTIRARLAQEGFRRRAGFVVHEVTAHGLQVPERARRGLLRWSAATDFHPNGLVFGLANEPRAQLCLEPPSMPQLGLQARRAAARVGS